MPMQKLACSMSPQALSLDADNELLHQQVVDLQAHNAAQQKQIAALQVRQHY